MNEKCKTCNKEGMLIKCAICSGMYCSTCIEFYNRNTFCAKCKNKIQMKGGK
jgi:hypothetical protein